MVVADRVVSSDCDKCDNFSDSSTHSDVKGAALASGVRNCVTTSRTSISYVTMLLLVTITLLCYSLPLVNGMAYSDPEYTDPDYTLRSADIELSRDDPDVLTRLLAISRLLQGRQNQYASGMFSSLTNRIDDDNMVVPKKRGPTSCINNCVKGGMSFIRCKSMCHW